VGTGVTTFKPGDPVIARAANGAYAQYAVADLDNVARKPAAFSFEAGRGRSRRGRGRSSLGDVGKDPSRASAWW
jgi:hypothetical protein